MAQISITIPDAQLSRVVDGLCGFTYEHMVIDNPEFNLTKAQFAKKRLIDWVKGTVATYELEVARNSVTVEPTDIT